MNIPQMQINYLYMKFYKIKETIKAKKNSKNKPLVIAICLAIPQIVFQVVFKVAILLK